LLGGSNSTTSAVPSDTPIIGSRILVFTGADPGDHAVGGAISTSADRLPEVLSLQREGVLALDDGRRVFDQLNAMISRTTRAAAPESSPPTGSASG
jgi:hypothetical protein